MIRISLLAMLLGLGGIVTGVLWERFFFKSAGLILFAAGILVYLIQLLPFLKPRKQAVRAVSARSRWENLLTDASRSLEQDGFARCDWEIPMRGERWAGVHLFHRLDDGSGKKAVCTRFLLLESVDTLRDAAEVFPSIEHLLERWIAEQQIKWEYSLQVCQVVCFVQETLDTSIEEYCLSPHRGCPGQSITLVGYERDTGTLVYLAGKKSEKEGGCHMTELVERHLADPETVQVIQNKTHKSAG